MKIVYAFPKRLHLLLYALRERNDWAEARQSRNTDLTCRWERSPASRKLPIRPGNVAVGDIFVETKCTSIMLGYQFSSGQTLSLGSQTLKYVNINAYYTLIYSKSWTISRRMRLACLTYVHLAIVKITRMPLQVELLTTWRKPYTTRMVQRRVDEVHLSPGQDVKHGEPR
jgi:hypothetical protein